MSDEHAYPARETTMTETPTPATEAEIRDFMEKLTRFRSSLPPRQQVLLEELTAAALGPAMAAAEDAEVAGYTAIEFPTIIATIPVLIGSPDPSKDKNGWLVERCSK
jgi:hypothetical protein